MIRLEGFAPRGAGGPYDLALGPGQVLGIIGGDGGPGRAFLEAAAGSARHGGVVEVDGRRRSARDIAYAPDEPEQILFGRTGRDALRGAGALAALGALGGEHLLERDFLELSSGERRRLALAAVIGSGRRLLLFDRPTAGLDPQGQQEFWSALRGAGTCAIVAALDEAEALRCDLLVALGGRGDAQPVVGSILPTSLSARAGWPPSPLAQLAWALGVGADMDRLEQEVDARCARERQG